LFGAISPLTAGSLVGELADIEAKSPIEVMFPGKNAIFINIEPLKYDYIYNTRD